MPLLEITISPSADRPDATQLAAGCGQRRRPLHVDSTDADTRHVAARADLPAGR